MNNLSILEGIWWRIAKHYSARVVCLQNVLSDQSRTEEEMTTY
jgi:hypothetical protein